MTATIQIASVKTPKCRGWSEMRWAMLPSPVEWRLRRRCRCVQHSDVAQRSVGCSRAQPCTCCYCHVRRSGHMPHDAGQLPRAGGRLLPGPRACAWQLPRTEGQIYFPCHPLPRPRTRAQLARCDGLPPPLGDDPRGGPFSAFQTSAVRLSRYGLNCGAAAPGRGRGQA